MTEAYKLKDLGKIIKEEAEKKGLAIAEEGLEELGKSVWIGTKRWVNESAEITPNPIDNFIAPALSQLDGFVNENIEKLDLDGNE